jgi:hypothetical protein
MNICKWLLLAGLLSFLGCRGPAGTTADHKTPAARNPDKFRFALDIDHPKVTIHLTEPKSAIEGAIPKPASATALLSSKMPDGFSYSGWSDKQNQQTVVNWFRNGALILASYSIAGLDRSAVNERVQSYVDKYGKPAEEQSAGHMIRQFGTSSDASTLRLETFRNGDRYRFSATLADEDEVHAMNEALKSIRVGKKP